jgi:hypothetical protein
MDIVYIKKCRYEIEEQKEVPVWYTGIYRPISSTDYTLMCFIYSEEFDKEIVIIMASIVLRTSAIHAVNFKTVSFNRLMQFSR